MQEYCGEESTPPEGVLLLERGWITREIVATYVDCRGCEGKGVQTHKNQEQEFLLERQVRNMWCGLCQEAWNWREGKAKREEITRVECIKYERRDAIVRKVSEWERRKILCPECRVGRKREWWNWREAVHGQRVQKA